MVRDGSWKYIRNRFDEDELYEAMDWLLQRQDSIEKKLAGRHLDNGGVALYDLTSSYFEGVTCPLAALGHPRDGKKGKLQVNYELLANAQGIPWPRRCSSRLCRRVKLLLKPLADRLCQCLG